MATSQLEKEVGPILEFPMRKYLLGVVESNSKQADWLDRIVKNQFDQNKYIRDCCSYERSFNFFIKYRTKKSLKICRIRKKKTVIKAVGRSAYLIEINRDSSII